MDGLDAELEEGRRLASQREDLIAQGVDPNELLIPGIPWHEFTAGRDDHAVCICGIPASEHQTAFPRRNPYRT